MSFYLLLLLNFRTEKVLMKNDCEIMFNLNFLSFFMCMCAFLCIYSFLIPTFFRKLHSLIKVSRLIVFSFFNIIWKYYVKRYDLWSFFIRICLEWGANLWVWIHNLILSLVSRTPCNPDKCIPKKEKLIIIFITSVLTSPILLMQQHVMIISLLLKEFCFFLSCYQK